MEILYIVWRYAKLKNFETCDIKTEENFSLVGSTNRTEIKYKKVFDNEQRKHAKKFATFADHKRKTQY